MAYNEAIAARVRDAVAALDRPTAERKMFGGLAFMLNGHMFCGVVGDELMVRLGVDGAEGALGRAHVREMDFTGRPMKGMVFVAAAGLGGDALNEWVERAVTFAETLPPK